MGLNQKFDGAFRSFGNADESKACISSIRMLLTLTENINVDFAEFRVGMVV